MKSLLAALGLLLTLPAYAQTNIHIDAGSPNAITAADGTPYTADPGPPAQFYDYGQFSNYCSSGNGTATITDTQNPKIYQTVRFGQNFSYAIPVPDGVYDVSLRFVECSYGAAGQRVMNVQLNGAGLLGNLDVYSEVGVARKDAHTIPNLSITGGTANLTFTSQIAGVNAVVSAIDLVQVGGPPPPPPPIQHVLVIVLENTTAADALAQPYLGGLVSNGWAAYFGNYHAITHPSEPNYLAMVGGDTFGVVDDANHDIAATHLGDLLEAKGLGWKLYAEEYPGNCFTGVQSGNYVRKENPFISFNNVRTNLARCNAHIVNANQFWTDVQNGTLPAFSFYVPGLQNNGHDTNVAFADNWLSSTFGPLFSSDAWWATNPLVILTFDEDDSATNANQVYTAIFGNTTRNGTVSERPYNHYSLLNLIESVFNLGSLGRHDASATPMTDVFQ